MFKENLASSLYRRAIVEALKITWRHKHFWLFGFFAAFAGYGSITEVMVRAHDDLAQLVPLLAVTRSPFWLLPGAATFKALIALSPYPALTVILLALLVLACTVVFAWIVYTAVAALVAGTHQVARGGDLDFGGGLKLGAARFWPVFAANLLAKVGVALALVLTGGNLLAALSDRAPVIGSVVYFLSFILFVALAMIVSVVAVYATNYAVEDKCDLETAVVRGWRLFVRHWLASIETAVALLAVSLIAVVLLIVLFAVLAVPFIALGALAYALGTPGFASGLILLFITGSIFLIIAFGSALTVFRVAAWSLLWNELAGQGFRPAIVRAAEWLKSKMRRR